MGNPWVPDEIQEPYLISYSPKTNIVAPGTVGTLSAKVASPATEYVLVEWYINNEQTLHIAQEINIFGDEAHQQFYIPKSTVDTLEDGDIVFVEARLLGANANWVELHTWEFSSNGEPQ